MTTITRTKFNELLDGIEENWEGRFPCSRGCCSDSGCAFCGVREDGRFNVIHKPDCLYLYARTLRSDSGEIVIDNEE